MRDSEKVPMPCPDRTDSVHLMTQDHQETVEKKLLLRYRSQALSGLAGLEHHGKVSQDKDDHWAVGPIKHADPRSAKVLCHDPSGNHRFWSLPKMGLVTSAFDPCALYVGPELGREIPGPESRILARGTSHQAAVGAMIVGC